jgi:hypothetical protein
LEIIERGSSLSGPICPGQAGATPFDATGEADRRSYLMIKIS